MQVWKFGLPQKKDGSCVHLKKDMSCSIYDNRPETCRVKDFGLKGDQLKKHYVNTTKACHLLIDKMKLNSKYKIDIKNYDK